MISIVVVSYTMHIGWMYPDIRYSTSLFAQSQQLLGNDRPRISDSSAQRIPMPEFEADGRLRFGMLGRAHVQLQLQVNKATLPGASGLVLWHLIITRITWQGMR